jgi:uncharacterized protein (TIGR02271 family)
MIRTEEVQTLITGGGNVVGSDGSKIGSIGQVYLDDQTSEPEWVTTRTGLFGGAESFVPLAAANVEGSDIRVPFDKNKVKDAPRIDNADGHLSQSDEAELYRYYGMDYSESQSDSGLPTGGGGLSTGGEVTGVQGVQGVQGTVGHDTSGPTTDDAMTRSEEEVRVGTQSQESGRVRLRKYVETEHVTQTVPVRKEKAVLEREPITDANVDQALDGPAISEEEHEVVLSEERPVVQKEAVPVERVRLGMSRSPRSTRSARRSARSGSRPRATSTTAADLSTIAGARNIPRPAACPPRPALRCQGGPRRSRAPEPRSENDEQCTTERARRRGR